jgi:HEAT repeat protein
MASLPKDHNQDHNQKDQPSTDPKQLDEQASIGPAMPVSPSRALTLPPDLCQRYGLMPHTPLRLVPTRNGILIVPLSPAFQSEDVRREVDAWQLGNTRATTLLPPETDASGTAYGVLLNIIRFLDSPDPHLRADALHAVVSQGASAVQPLLHASRQGSADFQWAVAEALGEIEGAEAVPQLIIALTEPSDDIRQHAARALARQEDPRSVEPFITLLRDLNPTLRLVAAESLGVLADLRGVEPLLGALEDGVDAVRREAADALLRIRDTRVINSYQFALHHASEPARQEIVRLLGALQLEAGLSLLIQSLGDPAERVRAEAANALGRLGDERAVEPLLLIAEQDTRLVRIFAMKALSRFGDGDTLCRRLIASKTLTPAERLRVLRFLQRATHYEYQATVRYLLSDVRGYCVELAEEDEEPSVRIGAREILAVLSGETLLRGSHPETDTLKQHLLRPTSGTEQEAGDGVDTLLRPHSVRIPAPSPNTPIPVTNENVSEIVNDHAVVAIRVKTPNRLARLLRRK